MDIKRSPFDDTEHLTLIALLLFFVDRRRAEAVLFIHYPFLSRGRSAFFVCGGLGDPRFFSFNGGLGCLYHTLTAYSCDFVCLENECFDDVTNLPIQLSAITVTSTRSTRND